MIINSNPSAKLEAFCGSAVTTDIKYTVGFRNMLADNVSDSLKQIGRVFRSVSDGTNDVQIAPYPGQTNTGTLITSGTVGNSQIFDYIKAHNTNASSVTVTIQINDGTDDIQWKGTIPAGGTAYCDNEGRWYVLDSTGALVTSIGIFPTKPMFLAYNSADDTNQTGNGAVAVVDFDTEVFDTQGNFAADTFTAPVAGKYLLTTGVQVSAIPAGCTSCIYQILTSNRAYNAAETFVAGTWTIKDMALSVIADMDAADTAVVRVVFSGGAGDTATIEGSSTLTTYFSGMQVG